MTTRNVLLALAVALLTVAMAVTALAGDQKMNLYGPADTSVSSPPEQVVESPYSGEIREPMETGALSDRTEVSSFPSIYANDPAYSGDPTFWPGGP
jgi:hypothetical protein